MKIFLSLICLSELWPLVLGLNHYPVMNSSFTSRHLSYLKNETRLLFDHGWDSYMKFGFPADEVRPITCKPYSRDPDIFNIDRNDVLGNYSVTLLDTLTSFAIMGDVEKFSHYISMVRTIDFNLDSTVQVFETAIRALGSLLSSHLYALEKFQLPEYDGFLLRQALDLGERLLPAYTHDTGIPLARVNLRDGVNLPNRLIKNTCSAGAASPFVEMTLLSILTNDTRFEAHSRRAFFTLWESRSKLDLLPMTIDPLKGNWLDAMTGIGASIDSFYEYALKGAILFNDDDLLDVWKKSYHALSTHSKVDWFFGNVHVDTGLLVSPWIDALSAFFSGLLVLSGNVDDAKKAHIPFFKLWNQYQGIPERWDFLPSEPSTRRYGSGDRDPISLEWYPLRPEFIESTYYLYRATKDPFYLRIGEQILEDYKKEFKVECGFAGFRDVRTRELQDRMESFVLSETLMYLYLLFDEENPINRDGQAIFSTEGHPFWIPRGVLKQYQTHKLLLSSNPQDILREEDSNKIEENLEGNIFSNIYEVVKEWSQGKLGNLSNLPSFNFTDDKQLLTKYHDFPISSTPEFYKNEPSICDVPDTSFGFFSKLMGDPDVFGIDAKFFYQWKYKNNTFELGDDFYSTFVNPKAYCQREPTSLTMEFLVGDRNEIPNLRIEKVVSGTGRVENIYISSFVGLRMKIELLTIGVVDAFNRLIDGEFMSAVQADVTYDRDGTCKPEDEAYSNSVLRVRVINDVLVKEGSVIYLSRESLAHSTIGSISTTENGYIKIENTLVMNMKVMTL